MLATLSLDGALVTGDAAHAQAETAALVLERGGDYLFALKANRPAMRREVELFFKDPPQPLAVFETTDADHGRIETRKHRVTHDIGWLFGERAEPGAPTMPGLAAIACVEAERIEGERVTRATRYYLSSARLTPERFAQAVRAYAHWAIENSLHWVLDVSFDEDRARNRADNGPFGRASFTDTLLATLRRQSFVAVVGASGSGKSSVVRAGLIPRAYAAARMGASGRR